jgi:hypothetical protein
MGERGETGETAETLRAELSQAMERIREQVDRLREGPTIGGALDDRSVIADLEAEYDALKQARAQL